MRWYSFIFLSLLLFACQKERIDLELQEISSGTNIDLYDVRFVNEQIGYSCGGQLWESGIILKTTDGGQTWLTQLETDNVLYALEFKSELEGVAVGYSGRAWKTEDGGNTWVLRESGPIGNAAPVYADAAFLNSSEIILASGNNYFFGGFSAFSFNFEGFLDSLIDVDMQGVHFFNNQDGLMCGYGSIYKTNNGGDTWEPTNAKGDYFKQMAFNEESEGLVIGYQGKIFSTTNGGNTWERNARKASFFTTKGNLESVDVNGGEAFICGQNSTLLYSGNFLGGEWLEVNTPYTQDFLGLQLINSTRGFVVGRGGLMFQFTY